MVTECAQDKEKGADDRFHVAVAVPVAAVWSYSVWRVCGTFHVEQEMLGFVPGCSSKKYKQHADQLLTLSNDPRIRQVCEWWQDPQCWYAFESQRGAEWWGKHGGPPTFCQNLPTPAPVAPAPVVPAPAPAPNCFYCNSALVVSQPITCCTCECSTWYMHQQCSKLFRHKRCFKCNAIYSYTDILIDEAALVNPRVSLQ